MASQNRRTPRINWRRRKDGLLVPTASFVSHLLSNKYSGRKNIMPNKCRTLADSFQNSSSAQEDRLHLNKQNSVKSKIVYKSTEKFSRKSTIITDVKLVKERKANPKYSDSVACVSKPVNKEASYCICDNEADFRGFEDVIPSQTLQLLRRSQYLDEKNLEIEENGEHSCCLTREGLLKCPKLRRISSAPFIVPLINHSFHPNSQSVLNTTKISTKLKNDVVQSEESPRLKTNTNFSENCIHVSQHINVNSSQTKESTLETLYVEPNEATSSQEVNIKIESVCSISPDVFNNIDKSWLMFGPEAQVDNKHLKNGMCDGSLQSVCTDQVYLTQLEDQTNWKCSKDKGTVIASRKKNRVRRNGKQFTQRSKLTRKCVEESRNKRSAIELLRKLSTGAKTDKSLTKRKKSLSNLSSG